MAESGSITDESLLLPDVVTSDCEEFLNRYGPFDDLPDTIKDEYSADQTCLRNSQSAFHNVLCQESLLEEKKLQVDSVDMFKKASKCVCTSTIVVSPDSLSLTPSTSLAMRTTENTEEDPDEPEPADGDIQIEYSSD